MNIKSKLNRTNYSKNEKKKIRKRNKSETSPILNFDLTALCFKKDFFRSKAYDADDSI